MSAGGSTPFAAAMVEALFELLLGKLMLQYHPSHESLESLTISDQSNRGEVKVACSSFTIIAPSGIGPWRFCTVIQLNMEGEYQTWTNRWTPSVLRTCASCCQFCFW